MINELDSECGVVRARALDGIIDEFCKRLYILVATQFSGLRDDSFGRLQLRNLPHATDCMEVCTNRTIVTFQIKHHVI